jgi:hypothetical protein
MLILRSILILNGWFLRASQINSSVATFLPAAFDCEPYRHLKYFKLNSRTPRGLGRDAMSQMSQMGQKAK